MRNLNPALLIVIVIAIVMGGTPISAQGQQFPGTLNLDALSEQITSAEEEAAIDGDTDGLVKERLTRARQRLAAAAKFQQEAAGYADAVVEAPVKIASLQQSRETFSLPPLPEEDRFLPLADLRSLLVKTELELLGSRQKFKQLNENQEVEKAFDIQARLAELNSMSLPAAAPDSATPALRRAQNLLIEASRTVRNAESSMLEQRQVSRIARLQILEAQTNLEKLRTAKLESRVATLNKWVSDNLQNEVEQLTENARRLIAQQTAPGDIADAATNNIEIGDKLIDLIDQLRGVKLLGESNAFESQRIQRRYESLRSQLESTNLSSTPEFGAALRQYRDQLIDFEEARVQIRQTQNKLTQARLGEFQLETGEAVFQASSEQDPALDRLLDEQNELRDRLQTAYSEYIDALTIALTKHEQLLSNSRRYADLIDKHLLWMPSARPVSLATVRNLPSAVSWLVGSENWKQVKPARPFLVILSLFCLVLATAILYSRQRIARYFKQISTRVGKVSLDRIRYSFDVLALTLALALVVPLCLLSASLLIDTSSPFSQGLSTALLVGSIMYFLLNILFKSVRPDGLGEVHFSWKASSLKVLRRHLPWFGISFTLLIMLNVLVDSAGDATVRNSLGRFAFVSSTLVLAWFVFYVVKETRNSIDDSISSLDKSQRLSIRYLLLPLVVLLPVLVAVLSFFGYHYTAIVLDTKLIQSGMLLLATMYIYYLALRWLSINERRYTLRSLKEQRIQERLQNQDRKAASKSGEAVPDTIDTKRIDLQTISGQTTALVKLLVLSGLALGLWPIWSSLFSSFQTLEAVELYNTSEFVDNVMTTVPVTLWDLCLAILVALITFIGAKNIPGSLEVALLSRMSLQQGTSYAITSISRYLIVIIGTVFFLQILGAQWSKVQWLVAALSVGLGFGLQEIVANFVSGIVLLFERPIRIGDTVTVGDQQGTVSKIRIRATTILDWDNKEVIIPNKNFITERLVNWTLSDATTRRTILVGVAYGSDVELTEKLLLEIGKSCEGVLETPTPVALFIRFGASSLDFELRVFIKSIRDIIPVTHRLNKAIDKAFREHGIEIAFPQQDLHFDDKPISIQLVNERTETVEKDQKVEKDEKDKKEGKD